MVLYGIRLMDERAEETITHIHVCTYQPSSGGLRVDELPLEEDEEVTDQEE